VEYCEGTTCSPQEPDYYWGTTDTICPEDCAGGCVQLQGRWARFDLKATPEGDAKPNGGPQANAPSLPPPKQLPSKVPHNLEPKRKVPRSMAVAGTVQFWNPRQGTVLLDANGDGTPDGSINVKVTSLEDKNGKTLQAITEDKPLYAKLVHVMHDGEEASHPTRPAQVWRHRYGLEYDPTTPADPVHTDPMGDELIKDEPAIRLNKYQCLVTYKGKQFRVFTNTDLGDK